MPWRKDDPRLLETEPGQLSDEARVIFECYVKLCAVPARMGFLEPALDNLRYALHSRGYAVTVGLSGPMLVHWVPFPEDTRERGEANGD